MSKSPTYPKLDYRTASDWHIYFVYTDREFINEVEALNQKHLNWSLKSKQKYKNGLPKFPKSKQKEAEADWDYIKTKYAINEFDLIFYLQRGLGGGWDEQNLEMHDVNAMHERNMGYVHLDDGRITVSLSSFVTQDFYIGLWDEITKYKQQLSKKSKRRAPSYHALVYAVFKGISAGKSYEQIHAEYMNNNLNYFSGKPLERFYTVKGLRDYYNLYRPSKSDT